MRLIERIRLSIIDKSLCLNRVRERLNARRIQGLRGCFGFNKIALHLERLADIDGDAATFGALTTKFIEL